LSIASNIINIVVLTIQRYSFITTLFLGPFDDVITKFYCTLGLYRSQEATPIILTSSVNLISFKNEIKSLYGVRLHCGTEAVIRNFTSPFKTLGIYVINVK
jgi:hypothetical protein